MTNDGGIGSQPSWLTRTTAFQAVAAAPQDRQAGSLRAESGWKPDFRRAAFVIRLPRRSLAEAGHPPFS